MSQDDTRPDGPIKTRSAPSARQEVLGAVSTGALLRSYSGARNGGSMRPMAHPSPREDVSVASATAITALDATFFGVRFDRLTPTEP